MSQDAKAGEAAAKWNRFTFKAVLSEREFGAKNPRAGQKYKVPMVAVIDTPRPGTDPIVHQAMTINSATAVQEAMRDHGLTENPLYAALSESLIKAMVLQDQSGRGTRITIA